MSVQKTESGEWPTPSEAVREALEDVAKVTGDDSTLKKFKKLQYDFDALEKIEQIEILQSRIDEILLDKFADKVHDVWARWMKYQFSLCKEEVLQSGAEEEVTGAIIIPKGLVDRWVRQMETEYKDLPEGENESYIEIAKEFLKILK